MDWPTTTIQYRLNLPSILHSVSPALSAVHVARAAALHPETATLLHPSHCPKCGTYRFSGNHPTRLVGPSAKKKRRRTTSSGPNVLQRRCYLCGFSRDAHASPSIDRSSVSADCDSSRTGAVTAVPTFKETLQKSPPADVLQPAAGTVAATLRTSAPPFPGQQSHTKPSRSKVPTLKDMLSRDRKREGAKAHKKKKEGHDGLSAFLKGL